MRQSFFALTLAAALVAGCHAQKTEESAEHSAPTVPDLIIATRDFKIQTHEGNPFTLADMRGKYSLVYFGFSNCPDVCINVLDGLSQVYDLLPPNLQKITQIYFVSVDPERDTPAAMADYVKAFHPTMIGLTGSGGYEESLKSLMADFSALGERSPKAKDGTYKFNHTSYSYLLNKNAEYVAHFHYQDTSLAVDKVAEQVANLIKGLEAPTAPAAAPASPTEKGAP